MAQNYVCRWLRCRTLCQGQVWAFTAAKASEIRNYGGRLLTGRTENREGCQISVQVTGARKNLISLPKMVEEGNDFTWCKKKGCFITNARTGMEIPLRSKPGGTPDFDLWLKKGRGYGKVVSRMLTEKQMLGTAGLRLPEAGGMDLRVRRNFYKTDRRSWRSFMRGM